MMRCRAGPRAFVRASSHPDRGELLRYVADELPMDQEVSARLAGLRGYHGM
jgi:hypothetical protein